MSSAPHLVEIKKLQENSPANRLAVELAETAAALTMLDADRLEAIERRVSAVTATQLAATPAMLPQLLEQHTMLGQMVEATAANLKVLVSVLNLEMCMETR